MGCLKMANEKRLIDATEARKHSTHDFITHFLDRCPTVQAVEVVHGRWIFKHNPIEDPKGYFIRIVCSECNLHTGQKSNYCPQCGAKMDGGNEDV